MKTVLHTLSLILALPFLWGCKSQSTLNTPVHTKEHLTALEGIQQGYFKIEAYEFRIPEKNKVVSDAGSYLIIQGEDMLIQYSANIPLGVSLRLRRQEGTIKSKEIKQKKNGDTVLRLSLDSQNALDKDFTIILYAGSNDCWIRCMNYRGSIDYDLKGKIYPFKQ